MCYELWGEGEKLMFGKSCVAVSPPLLSLLPTPSVFDSPFCVKTGKMLMKELLMQQVASFYLH